MMGGGFGGFGGSPFPNLTPEQQIEFANGLKHDDLGIGAALGITCKPDATMWAPPATKDSPDPSDPITCPNDLLNAPARDWSYQCGCIPGAALSCPPNHTLYDSAPDHHWCNARGIDTCDNFCIRKGISCYRSSGDFSTGDPCTDKATQIACCDPRNPADPKLCPPGYCNNSKSCKSALYTLCNTDAGFAAFPDMCKTFAFQTRGQAGFDISGVAEKWCRLPGNADLPTDGGNTGYSAPPKSFCSCFTAFDGLANMAGLDLIHGHPKCFNGGCAKYGYSNPTTINENCPDVCIQVVNTIVTGDLQYDNNTITQNCPNAARLQLINAHGNATAAEIAAALHQACLLRGDCDAPADSAPPADSSPPKKVLTPTMKAAIGCFIIVVAISVIQAMAAKTAAVGAIQAANVLAAPVKQAFAAKVT